MEVQEILMVATLAVFNVCWGVMASLPVRTIILIFFVDGLLLVICHQSVQAPLFPIEASGKGATGSQISPGIIEKNDQTYLNQFWAPCTPASSSHPFLSPSWSAGRSQNIMFVNFSQVWSFLRLPGWTPCGYNLSGSLWHNHLRLRPQPVLALRLPGQVPRGGEHGSALVHRLGNSLGNLPNPPCSRLLPP